MKKIILLASMTLLVSGIVLAQDTAVPPDPPDPPDAAELAEPAPPPAPDDPRPIVRRREITMRTGGMMGGEPGMGMMGPGRGRWWKNPDVAQKLGLSDAQVSKMDQIFQDHRLKLIDLHATLEKQEVLLEPMINADHPDEDRVLSQIDQVAQARAELEKANARMLFDIRNVLTPDQWKKLQAARAERRMNRREDRPFMRQRMRPHQPGGAGPGTPPPPATLNPSDQ